MHISIQQTHIQQLLKVIYNVRHWWGGGMGGNKTDLDHSEPINWGGKKATIIHYRSKEALSRRPKLCDMEHTF